MWITQGIMWITKTYKRLRIRVQDKSKAKD